MDKPELLEEIHKSLVEGCVIEFMSLDLLSTVPQLIAIGFPWEQIEWGGAHVHDRHAFMTAIRPLIDQVKQPTD